MSEGGDSEESVLVRRRVLAIPRERVFAAWLDPESLAQWMRPRDGSTATVELDARVGGKFRIVMNHGGAGTEHSGEYLVIDPPSRLSFTWSSVNTEFRPTVVTVEFRVHGQGTELILTHRGLPSSKIDAHRNGWAQILQKLDEALERVPDED
jgi:uncharacterized protein YndB with AHSA1/START domain